jgi:hypothetical protein
LFKVDVATQDAIERSSHIAIHELFHVFQQSRHPRWSANEAMGFLYPSSDVDLLTLRRLESLAWSRALNASGADLVCWTRRGVELRRQRFAAIKPQFSEYERMNELNEGLASYVELRARGSTTIAIPTAEFPATDVRRRSYVIGPSLALLLDRLSPGWQSALEKNDERHLDELLEAAVTKASQPDSARCSIDASQLAALEQAARSDAAAVTSSRAAARRQFEALAGWRISIEGATDAPLQTQGFDPLNIQVVPAGLLHKRMLGLTSTHCKLQMLQEPGSNLQTLTEAAGDDPLFSGIKPAVIAGLTQPEITRDAQRVTLRAPGLSAEFDGAEVSVEGTHILVRLKRQPAANPGL